MPVGRFFHVTSAGEFRAAGMTNRKLNFGGIFGGLVCGGAAAAVFYLLSRNGAAPLRAIRMVILAALGGAALGNWIWRLALPTEHQEN